MPLFLLAALGVFAAAALAAPWLLSLGALGLCVADGGEKNRSVPNFPRASAAGDRPKIETGTGPGSPQEPSLVSQGPAEIFEFIEMRMWKTDDEIARVNEEHGGDMWYNGISPTPKGEVDGKFDHMRKHILERLPPDCKISFNRDLEGADLLVIGPGRYGIEILQIMKEFPELKSIHIVDVNDSVFRHIESHLKASYIERNKLPIRIYGYRTTALELPEELRSQIDLIFDSHVFDESYFSEGQLKQVSQQIAVALKPKGLHISQGYGCVLNSSEYASDMMDMIEPPCRKADKGEPPCDKWDVSISLSAPKTPGSIQGVFEYLCENNITSPQVALTQAEIAEGLNRSFLTIDSDIRALFHHLHLIEIAPLVNGIHKYFVRQDIREIAQNLCPILGQFKGDLSKPPVDELERVYTEEVKLALREIACRVSHSRMAPANTTNKPYKRIVELIKVALSTLSADGFRAIDIEVAMNGSREELFLELARCKKEIYFMNVPPEDSQTGMCYLAAYAFYHAFTETFQGHKVSLMMGRHTSGRDHYWIQIGDEIVIDITYGQFNPDDKERVLVTTKDNLSEFGLIHSRPYSPPGIALPSLLVLLAFIAAAALAAPWLLGLGALVGICAAGGGGRENNEGVVYDISGEEKEEALAAFNAFNSAGSYVFEAVDIGRIYSGHINATYCLTLRLTGQKFIVQKLNRIFDIDAIDNNLQLLEEAQAKGEAVLPAYWQKVHYLDVLGQEKGKIYYDGKNEAWRVMDFVPGDIRIFNAFAEIPAADRRDAARSLGTAIAVFAKMLDAILPDLWQEPLPNFHNAQYHLDYLNSILRGEERVLSLSRDSSQRVKVLPDIIERYPGITILREKIFSRQNLAACLEGLGLAVAHGDTKLNNAVFRKNRAGKLECVCFIDLDTIQRGNRLDDLGDALRFAGNPAGEQPEHLDDVKIDMEIVNNIIEGYLSKIEELYGQARAEELGRYSLSAFKLFLYAQCMRFFADALVGNRYWKLKPGQPEDINLYRAEVQMRALEELEIAQSGAAGGVPVIYHPYTYESNLNRGFQALDTAFNGAISEAINSLISQKGSVRILVIGAGRGKLVYDLLVAYKDKVRIQSLSKEDLLHTPESLAKQVTAFSVGEAERFMATISAGHRVIDLEQGLSFWPRGVFDLVIVSQYTLIYMRNKISLLEGVKRILTSDGQAFVHLCGLWLSGRGQSLPSFFDSLGEEYKFNYAEYTDVFPPYDEENTIGNFGLLRIKNINPENCSIPLTLEKEVVDDSGQINSHYRRQSEIEPLSFIGPGALGVCAAAPAEAESPKTGLFAIIRKWDIPSDERLEAVRLLKETVKRSDIAGCDEAKDRVDLHSHTIYSDAEQTPSWLVVDAWVKGLFLLAVTDHNTFDGLPEAILAARILGVRLIPGIEFDAFDEETGIKEFHLLAYWLAGTAQEFILWLQQAKQGKKLKAIEAINRNKRKRTELIRQGFNRAQRIDGTSLRLMPKDMRNRLPYVPNKNDLARLLIDKYGKQILGTEDMFEISIKYFSRRKIRVDVSGIAVAQPLRAIARFCDDNGFTPVLVHPLDLDMQHRGTELARELLERHAWLFKGVEVWHSGNSSEEAEKIAELVDELNQTVYRAGSLWKTVGSDSHGNPRTGIILGLGARGNSFPFAASVEALRELSAAMPGENAPQDVSLISVLVICNANLERSPLAEGLIRKYLPADLANRVEVNSAGLRVSDPEAPLTTKICREKGIDISSHRATQVTRRMIDKVSVIFAVSPDVRLFLLHRFPSAREKSHLLLPAGQDLRGMTSPLIQESAYREYFQMVKDNLDEIFRIIREATDEYAVEKRDGYNFSSGFALPLFLLAALGVLAAALAVQLGTVLTESLKLLCREPSLLIGVLGLGLCAEGEGVVSQPFADEQLRSRVRKVAVFYPQWMHPNFGQPTLGGTTMLYPLLIASILRSFPQVESISVWSPPYPALTPANPKIIVYERQLLSELSPDIVFMLDNCAAYNEHNRLTTLEQIREKLPKAWLVYDLRDFYRIEIGASSRWIVGDRRAPILSYQGGVYRLNQEVSAQMTVPEQIRFTLENLGLSLPALGARLIPVNHAARARVEEKLRRLNLSGVANRVVLFNLLGRTCADLLPDSEWAFIMAEFINRGFEVVLRAPEQEWRDAGKPREEQRIQAILSSPGLAGLQDRIKVFHPLNLDESIALLAHPAVGSVISLQTGLAHIALELGKPTLIVVQDRYWLPPDGWLKDMPAVLVDGTNSRNRMADIFTKFEQLISPPAQRRKSLFIGPGAQARGQLPDRGSEYSIAALAVAEEGEGAAEEIEEYYSRVLSIAPGAQCGTLLGVFAPSLLKEVAQILRDIQRDYPRKRRFLDLGSGDGRVAILAERMGFLVTGVEYDRRLIEIAKGAEVGLLNGRGAGIKWLHDEFITSRDLRWPDYEVIYYYDRGSRMQGRLFERLKKKMRPGAILIIYRQAMPVDESAFLRLRQWLFSSIFQKENLPSSAYLKCFGKSGAVSASADIRIPSEPAAQFRIRNAALFLLAALVGFAVAVPAVPWLLGLGVFGLCAASGNDEFESLYREVKAATGVENLRVLDLGTGDASFIKNAQREIWAADASFTGIDHSPGQIKAALAVNGIKVQKMSWYQPKFGKGSFNLVTLNYPNPAEVSYVQLRLILNQAYRICAAGGALAFASTEDDSNGFVAKQVSELIKEAGFGNVIVFSGVDMPASYPETSCSDQAPRALKYLIVARKTEAAISGQQQKELVPQALGSPIGYLEPEDVRRAREDAQRTFRRHQEYPLTIIEDNLSWVYEVLAPVDLQGRRIDEKLAFDLGLSLEELQVRIKEAREMLDNCYGARTLKEYLEEKLKKQELVGQRLSAQSDTCPPVNVDKRNHSDYDVLIIGGGIVGAGVAWAAQDKGLKVFLAEQNEFASGASSKSTKLIHAGIRYLYLAYAELSQGRLSQGLKNLLFVLRASRERKRIQNMFPELVSNIPILIPIYKHNQRGMVLTFLGVGLYYLFALFAGGGLPRPRLLFTKKQVLSVAPNLNPQALRAGFIYWDSLTDDKELVLANIKAAASRGAQTREHCQVINYVFDRASGDYLVSLKDNQNDETFQLRARHVVNAAGAWIDRVRKNTPTPKSDNLILPVAGAHLNLNRQPLPISLALETEDKRIVFLLNQPDGTARLGTTERIHEDPDNPAVTRDEALYLLGAINTALVGDKVEPDDILSTDAGIRPLVAAGALSDLSRVSREHRIAVDKDGLINVCGVKLTDYWCAARETVSLILR